MYDMILQTYTANFHSIILELSFYYYLLYKGVMCAICYVLFIFNTVINGKISGHCIYKFRNNTAVSIIAWFVIYIIYWLQLSFFTDIDYFIMLLLFKKITLLLIIKQFMVPIHCFSGKALYKPLKFVTKVLNYGGYHVQKLFSYFYQK